MATTAASKDSSQPSSLATSGGLPALSTSIASNPHSLSSPANRASLQRSKSPKQLGESITGLSLVQSPTGAKAHLEAAYSTPPLTGAAAMADERRMREEQAQETANQTSANPSATVLESLMGTAGTGMSRAQDAPPEATNLSEGMREAANKVKIPEFITGDANQTSPISMSSIASLDATSAPVTATANASDGTLAPELAAVHGNGSSHARGSSDGYVAAANAVESSHRANTYPGPAPLEQSASGNQRSNSMSMAAGQGQGPPRSPSTRRHKCPYCTQDFTRHHNLKSHLLTHSQEKPYVCQTCQARFRRLHDLKRHTKLHTGERPHTCNKCGRRFARGDALARHNKGSGGCAGRRSSFEGDEDFSGIGDDSMDGVVYGEDGGPEEEEQSPRAPRRGSEPNAKARQRQDSGPIGGYSHHSSTYPPPAPHMLGSNARGGLHPPNPYPAVQTSPREHGGSTSSTLYGPPGTYAQGLISESPKPLSPGGAHPDSNRLSVSGPSSLHRNRSPSLTQHLHHQQYARASGSGGTSPGGIGLPPPPPPTNSGHPQLPQLPGLNAATDPRLGSSYPPPPQPTHPPASSQHGSHSSHGPSSGGSMREILHGGPAAAAAAASSLPENDVWKYVKELEGRFNRMQEEYEVRIRNLQEEIHTLRSAVGAQR